MSPDTLTISLDMLTIIAVGIVMLVTNLLMLAYIIGKYGWDGQRDIRPTRDNRPIVVDYSSQCRICQVRCPHNTFR